MNPAPAPAPAVTESEPASPPAPAVPWWRRWAPWARWALGVAVILAVVAGVIGLRGGWDRVEPRGLPEVAPGELVDLRPHAVRVIEWTVTDEVELVALELETEADAWIAIHVEMTTKVDLSTGIQTPTVQLVGVPTTRNWPATLRLDNTGGLYRLDPDLPVDVVLLFPVKQADVPDELTVALSTLTYMRSTLSEEMVWLLEEPVAQVTVPRNDSFVEPLIEEEDE